MKAVVILSGGMDSTTLLYDIHAHVTEDIHCLSFNYGQRHSKELEFAARTCATLGLTHKIVPFTDDLKSLLTASALTDLTQEVPEGHYAADNMKATVVPNRNMIMLSLAAGYAISIGAQKLFYGAHAGDHTIYPDCRPEFLAAMQLALTLCHFDGGIALEAPYMNITKSDICAIGRDLGVPYGDTWTCYAGKDVPCGKCGACQERAEAFDFAGIPDPLLEV
jgi:7-cyano-7-deazaguanine synthase